MHPFIKRQFVYRPESVAILREGPFPPSIAHGPQDEPFNRGTQFPKSMMNTAVQEADPTEGKDKTMGDAKWAATVTHEKSLSNYVDSEPHNGRTPEMNLQNKKPGPGRQQPSRIGQAHEPRRPEDGNGHGARNAIRSRCAEGIPSDCSYHRWCSHSNISRHAP